MEQPKFDLAHWQPLVKSGLSDLREMFSTSPVSIVIVEHWRRTASGGLDWGPRVPVQPIVWGKGESAERHHTKVGGLPYRPADLPWPHDPDGRPMTFLAQFNFEDMLPQLGPLPGDVLLMFMRTSECEVAPKISSAISPYDVDSMTFEWHSLGMKNLVEADQIPPVPPISWTEFQVWAKVEPLPPDSVIMPNCYGVHHHSWDYIEEERLVAALDRIIPDEALPSHEFFRAATLRGLARVPSNKLGGLPLWYSPPEAPPEGRFIACFSGVEPTFEIAYPWVNQSEPLDINEATRDDNSFSLRDGGHVNIFLKNDGTIEWIADFL